MVISLKAITDALSSTNLGIGLNVYAHLIIGHHFNLHQQGIRKVKNFLVNKNQK